MKTCKKKTEKRRKNLCVNVILILNLLEGGEKDTKKKDKRDKNFLVNVKELS